MQWLDPPIKCLLSISDIAAISYNIQDFSFHIQLKIVSAILSRQGLPSARVVQSLHIQVIIQYPSYYH